jgi:hypothetical protein
LLGSFVAIELDDVDADCRTQVVVGSAALIDPGDQIMHGDRMMAGDIVQRLPHDRLQPNAGLAAIDKNGTRE